MRLCSYANASVCVCFPTMGSLQICMTFAKFLTVVRPPSAFPTSYWPCGRSGNNVRLIQCRFLVALEKDLLHNELQASVLNGLMTVGRVQSGPVILKCVYLQVISASPFFTSLRSDCCFESHSGANVFLPIFCVLL